MSTDSRLTIRTVASHAVPATFADDVRTGLGGRKKSLPAKYLYDELGSKLFEAICLLPEYYLMRAEREVLERYADDIVERVGPPVELVEMGSGSAEKTTLLIEALLRRQPELHYIPVDISDQVLEASSRDLLNAYPDLRITGYASDYSGALAALQKEPARARRLALFLGSNVGNLDKAEAHHFLCELRGALRPGDGLLLGADLKKSPAVLEAAYDDPQGVTAAFNLNLLARINRRLDANFDLRRFLHHSRYDEQTGRIVTHIVSIVAQTVEIRELGMTVSFEEGEMIHTEYSHKYDVDGLSEMAREAGFTRAETWLDSEGRFSDNLFVAVR